MMRAMMMKRWSVMASSMALAASSVCATAATDKARLVERMQDAQAATDWKMNAELLTYSRSKGLFAGIDLDGSVLSQNEDDTRVMYGDAVPYETILKGNQATPPEAQAFVRTVAKYFTEAKASNK